MNEKITSKIISKLIEGQPVQASSQVEALTDRELFILEMIGNGLSTREMGDHLHLSIKTIESYRERIKEKLNLDSAHDVLKHAIQWSRGKGDL